jgi:hypothetical protein
MTEILYRWILAGVVAPKAASRSVFRDLVLPLAIPAFAIFCASTLGTVAANSQEADPRSTRGVTANTIEQPITAIPQVIYENGQLTIDAQNSTLADVLSSLRKTMGTESEISASAGGQRLWIHLGPGPARTVLRDLLDATPLDYVIQASESDPDGIKKLLLTSRVKAADGPVNDSNGAWSQIPHGGKRGALRNQQTPVENPDSEAPISPTALSTEQPDSSSSASAPPSSPVTPQAAMPITPQAALNERQPLTPTTGPSGGNTPPPATTDVDTMIEQLQSMYQQRRQIQAQQNQFSQGHSSSGPTQ